MVSIYSLRPVYTFLCRIINDSAIASFVQKRKVLKFCGFLRTYGFIILLKKKITKQELQALRKNAKKKKKKEYIYIYIYIYII